MVTCQSIEEALKVPNVIHIESGKEIIAYQVGDELPEHCKTPPEQEPE